MTAIVLHDMASLASERERPVLILDYTLTRIEARYEHYLIQSQRPDYESVHMRSGDPNRFVNECRVLGACVQIRISVEYVGLASDDRKESA